MKHGEKCGITRRRNTKQGNKCSVSAGGRVTIERSMTQGFFFSIVDDNLRQGCATRSAINTSNDTSPNAPLRYPRVYTCLLCVSVCIGAHVFACACVTTKLTKLKGRRCRLAAPIFLLSKVQSENSSLKCCTYITGGSGKSVALQSVKSRWRSQSTAGTVSVIDVVCKYSVIAFKFHGGP